MKRFEITNTNSGIVLGAYEGETAEQALDAMARDAGYPSYAAIPVEEDTGRLQVTELVGMSTAEVSELREAAYDYAHLLQVQRVDLDTIGVHRAYDRLRKALGEPIGLKPSPYVATSK